MTRVESLSIIPHYKMSHTKSGCDQGAAAEVGKIRQQIASKWSEWATGSYYICMEADDGVLISRLEMIPMNMSI